MIDQFALQDQNALLQTALDKIGSTFIRHGGIDHAWKVLERTYKYGFRLHESQPGYIYGESRCGKSETAHRWIQHMTGKRPVRGSSLVNGKEEAILCQVIEGRGVKIVYLDLTNGASPLEACKAILKVFHYQRPMTRMKQTEATGLAIGMLIARCVDCVIVDEAQQIFKGEGEQSANAIAEWLLPMANARAFKIILIGARSLERLFRVQSAEARHFGVALLEPFKFNTKVNQGLWAAFLEMFLEKVPARTGALRVDGDAKKPITERNVFNFYYATRGSPGELAKFLETTVICAFERNNGVLPDQLLLEDFVEAFEFLWRHDRRMKGANPFSIVDRKEIPTISLSGPTTFKEQPEETRPSAPKVGGRIHAR
ncbi:ATP-binding protein [Bradyrhizobium embrapense]